MTALLTALHLGSLMGLAIYGLLGFLTLALYWRHRLDAVSYPSLPDKLPIVTVQLPVYNEREVIGRLIDAVAALDYPRDRLEIQLLDDSTDDTTTAAAALVAAHQAQGIRITHLHRRQRREFKAGALQDALPAATGEYVAIFDADFVPHPDFLRRTVPYLVADKGLGVVQARWGHLNRVDSALTQAQAIALDKHFAVEQLVRHRADFFPKFNGAAGVWRRQCIEEVGGWQGDTVCEDLCLSTRAALAGWRFHFAADVVVPAELPGSILAYKTQQARWAMGATQCLTKYGRRIVRAGGQTPLARLYSLLSLGAYATQGLFLLLLLVQLPLVLTGYRLPGWVLLFGPLGMGQPLLFILAQQALHRDWPARLRHLPALLLIAIGTAPSNSQAVLHALLGRRFTFARTPKGGGGSYRSSAGRMLWLELALMAYSASTLAVAIRAGVTGPILLLTTALLGLGYVAWLGFRETLQTPAPVAG